MRLWKSAETRVVIIFWLLTRCDRKSLAFELVSIQYWSIFERLHFELNLTRQEALKQPEKVSEMSRNVSSRLFSD